MTSNQKVLAGKTEEKNSKGRLFLECITHVIQDGNCGSYHELKRQANNDEEWRIAVNSLWVT